LGDPVALLDLVAGWNRGRSRAMRDCGQRYSKCGGKSGSRQKGSLGHPRHLGLVATGLVPKGRPGTSLQFVQLQITSFHGPTAATPPASQVPRKETAWTLLVVAQRRDREHSRVGRRDAKLVCSHV